jgi:putative transposase
MDILALLHCLRPYLTATRLRQFSRIAFAMLAMTGRVTMLGLSRWAGKGGSYRTIQRFFYTVLPWANLFWVFFRQHVYRRAEVYLLAGDEVVVTKAGKCTHGLDRFFSSLYGKPVRGLSFFTLALVSPQTRRAFPLRVEQIVRSETGQVADSVTTQAPPPSAKRRRGRPQGSPNKDRTQVTFSAELLRIKAMLEALRQRIAGVIPLTYLLLDGHFGNNPALQMARQCDLHLISKLRCDAALYLPYDGPYSGRGPRRKYGRRLDYRNLPDHYLKETRVEGHIQTRIYQIQALHKEFAQPLNVVIIVKTNLRSQAAAHVVLFSSDLELAADQLIDYYSLRFQIEFNFRDAKQYWGLEDFMNVTPTAVTNAVNLSLFMVNLSYPLLTHARQGDPAYSLLDLKADRRAYRYMDEMIKILPQKPEPDLLAQLLNTVASLGRIHALQPHFNSV